MPRPFLIFSQIHYLFQLVDTNSHSEWQTVQIQISWLLQKPTDLDLHCLQTQGISGFSRTRVKLCMYYTHVGIRQIKKTSLNSDFYFLICVSILKLIISFKMNGHTLRFCNHFHKGDNFCDFLFACTPSPF